MRAVGVMCGDLVRVNIGIRRRGLGADIDKAHIRVVPAQNGAQVRQFPAFGISGADTEDLWHGGCLWLKREVVGQCLSGSTSYTSAEIGAAVRAICAEHI